MLLPSNYSKRILLRFGGRSLANQALMQSIAFENNLSETAFVQKLDDENYAIRWFSPMDEVAFAVMRPLQIYAI
jgi:hypothetical protein